MKKLSIYTVFIALALSLVSVSLKQTNVAYKIIGEWRSKNNPDLKIKFKKDFTYYNYDVNSVIGEGKWKIVHDTILRYTVIKTSLYKISKPFDVDVAIKFRDKNTLCLTQKNSVKEEPYTRVLGKK